MTVLRNATAAAAAGHGSVVAISGAAGTGKTSLVRAFARQAGAGGARVLLAGCDDHLLLRPLGPLWVMAQGLGGPLAEAVAAGRPADVLRALLAELAGNRPTVLIVEDVHWADAATMDVLLHAARRVGAIGAVLAVTFRDGDLGGEHPLHRLTGAGTGSTVHHLRLGPLNRSVVLPAGAPAELIGALRLMRHAVEAGDAETVVAVAPAAARDAALAGAHHQALRCYEAVRPFVDRLPPSERAAVLAGYAVELRYACRFAEAVQAGEEAARWYEQLGDPLAWAETLSRLARHLLAAGRSVAAERAAERATRLLDGAAQGPAAVLARLAHSAVLAGTGRPGQAAALAEQAQRGTDRPDLVVGCRGHLGVASAELGDPLGLRLLRDSVSAAVAGGHHEYAAHGHALLAELLHRNLLLPELARCVAAGLAVARDHGLPGYAYDLEAQRCLLLLRRGDWPSAERGLRQLVDGGDEPGPLHVISRAVLGRLLARRGDPAAAGLLADSWQRARRYGQLVGLAYAGIGYAEWAWLTGDLMVGSEVAAVLLPWLEPPGSAPFRAELLRYLARLGMPAAPFPGCPQPYAAGLRGDWVSAAQLWHTIGAPYEAALELAESDRTDEVAGALRTLQELGADAAAIQVRHRLRARGARPPRSRRAETLDNPAGLTNRQLTVLSLLAEGLTNREIAAQLSLSVRTVDHHVAAILDKLGVPSRRRAAAAAARLGITAPVTLLRR